MNVNTDPPMADVRGDESSDSSEDNQIKASAGKQKASPSSPPPTIRSGKKVTRPKRNPNKREEMPVKKFSIQLSRKEIEEDFIAMTGKKPPRKPNKHPKSVQSKLDVSNNLSQFLNF